jgi:hypothetical protein
MWANRAGPGVTGSSILNYKPVAMREFLAYKGDSDVYVSVIRYDHRDHY